MPYGKLALDQIETSGNLAVNGNVTVTGNVTVGADLFVSGSRVEPLVLGTAQTTTSGTNIDLSGVPNWANRITVTLNGVSTNGTSGMIIQLIVNGTPVITGYVGAADHIITGLAPAAYTTGFGLTDTTTAAAYIIHGCLTLNKSSDTIWNGFFVGSSTNSAGVILGAGYVPITGNVTGVRVTTLGGTNTFDAGTINIMYE